MGGPCGRCAVQGKGDVRPVGFAGRADPSARHRPADILDEVSDTEVLEVGGDVRRRLSWRVRLLVVLVLLLVGVTAYVVDRQARQRDEQAVAECAEEVATSVDLATRRLRAAYEYIRPSLGVPLDPAFEEGIFRVVSRAAEGADSELAPRETCADISIWAWHSDLVDKRDRCTALLDAHRTGLAAVAEDGKALREWMDLRREC